MQTHQCRAEFKLKYINTNTICCPSIAGNKHSKKADKQKQNCMVKNKIKWYHCGLKSFSLTTSKQWLQTEFIKKLLKGPYKNSKLQVGVYSRLLLGLATKTTTLI